MESVMWPSQGNQSHRNNTHTHPHVPSLSRAQLFRTIEAYRMLQLEKIPATAGIQQWFPSIFFLISHILYLKDSLWKFNV